MNHYLIRDAQDSPQAVTAETLDEALQVLGLDPNDITKAEQMIDGALPPANWKDKLRFPEFQDKGGGRNGRFQMSFQNINRKPLVRKRCSPYLSIKD